MDTPKEASEAPSAPLETAVEASAKIAAAPPVTEVTDAATSAHGLVAAAIARIVEPAKSPTKSDAPAALPKIEPLAPQEIEATARETSKIDISPIDIAPAAAAINANPTAGRRLPLMAASIAMAAAFGVLAGALGVSGLTGSAPASESRPGAEETRIMNDVIAQLRADIAGLKASVDAATRNSSVQISKITERFDRSDRLQSEAAARIARETTGSIGPATQAAAPAAVPLPPPAPTPPIVAGWVVRDVSSGIALIQGRFGLIEVEQGDVVPGLGRIEAIRRQDGRWVVLTAKGLITSR